MAKKSIDLNNLPDNKKGTTLCQCLGIRGDEFGCCRSIKSHDKSDCGRVKRGQRSSIPGYCYNCQFDRKPDDTDQTDQDKEEPEKKVKIAKEPKGSSSSDSPSEMKKLELMRNAILQYSDLGGDRIQEDQIPQPVQNTMFDVLSNQKPALLKEENDALELFIYRCLHSKTLTEYHDLLRVTQYALEKVIIKKIPHPSDKRLNSPVAKVTSTTEKVTSPTSKGVTTKASPQEKQAESIPAQPVVQNETNKVTSQGSEQSSDITNVLSEHKSEQSEQSEQSDQEEEVKPVHKDDDQDKQPPKGPPPPPPGAAGAATSDPTISSKTTSPSQPAKRGRPPKKTEQEPAKKTKSKPTREDEAMDYNSAESAVLLLQDKESLTEAEAIFRVHETVLNIDPEEERKLYTGYLPSNMFCRVQDNFGNGHCFLYAIYDAILALCEARPACKDELEDKGFKHLFSKFRTKKEINDDLLQIARRKRITSLLALAITDDLVNDKEYRNKLKPDLKRMGNRQLKKELSNTYLEGWGINEEADAYLLQQSLGIDILLYKDLDGKQTRMHSFHAEKYHVIEYNVDVSDGIQSWDPSDPEQLRDNYLACLNILTTLNGQHFVALIPNFN